MHYIIIVRYLLEVLTIGIDLILDCIIKIKLFNFVQVIMLVDWKSFTYKYYMSKIFWIKYCYIYNSYWLLIWFVYVLFSSRMQAGEDGADVRVGGPRALHQVPRNIPAAAHTTGIGGTA